MNSKEDRAAQEERKREILAASLRENLKRRKTQQRLRAKTETATSPGDPSGRAAEER